MASQDGDSSSPTFPLSSLPPELRTRIWEMAIQDATADRVIRVALYNLMVYTNHTCYTMDGQFCGRHGSCSREFDWQAMDPHHTTKCIADGYFAVTDQFPEPEESDMLGRVAAICRESRHLVTSKYPKTLKVYRGQWHPGVESRLVRCSTETDVLLVTDVPDLSIDHTRDSYQQGIDDRRSIFPLDDALFAGFRDMVSSFEHVAFHYIGSRGFQPLSSIGVNITDWPGPELVLGARDVLNSSDSAALIPFFVSMRHLYLWPDPEYWPTVHENLTRVDDIKYIFDGGPEVQGLCIDAFKFVRAYHMSLVNVGHHFVETDEHWMARPKRLRRIGCYGSSLWLNSTPAV